MAATLFSLPPAAERYDIHGVFESGQQATSVGLPGFEVDVAALFAAGEE